MLVKTSTLSCLARFANMKVKSSQVKPPNYGGQHKVAINSKGNNANHSYGSVHLEHAIIQISCKQYKIKRKMALKETPHHAATSLLRLAILEPKALSLSDTSSSIRDGRVWCCSPLGVRLCLCRSTKD